jgi:hypothetical protein
MHARAGDGVFKGRNLRVSPDLFVGYHRGYRTSWQTALGAVPQASDFGGDHGRALHARGRTG